MASNEKPAVSFYEEPKWNSEPAWRLPSWGEPVIVASILIGSMILTRRRGYRILGRKGNGYGLLDGDSGSGRSSDEINRDYLLASSDTDDSSLDGVSTVKDRSKQRRCCCVTLSTPNTSRFADHYHSRFLQRFPYLIEMFYWIITYGFYRCTKVLSQKVFSNTAIWDVAQEHGLAILEFEEFSWMSFLWPVPEREVQQWFMHGHQTFLTVLNRSYALIHIPGTVGFIAWWYYVAPSHATFAVVRRTMTLTNFIAFLIFICYPCMPPRFLPPEYGFLDSVGRNNGQSIWMEGKYVNSLAAMPSMHFGYSFCIGCTMIYHSGIGRRTLERGEPRKSKAKSLIYVLLGIVYPAWIFITIVATANHYYLDAFVAFFVVIFSFQCNELLLGFLPLEDLLLWCLRLEKPVPTTGTRFGRGAL